MLRHLHDHNLFEFPIFESVGHEGLREGDGYATCYNDANLAVRYGAHAQGPGDPVGSVGVRLAFESNSQYRHFEAKKKNKDTEALEQPFGSGELWVLDADILLGACVL